MDPRAARSVAYPDGTLVLRVQCCGEDPNPAFGGFGEPEFIPCQNEQRYTVTAEQLAMYIEGSPLDEIWPEPDPYLIDRLCDIHRAVVG